MQIVVETPNLTCQSQEKYADEISNKINIFLTQTKTKKNVHVIFVTTYGLVSNKYSKQFVQNELTINNLFI